ncbi:MAG: hypothetical protein GY832_40900 [Chloroflexi bacterium]|nr:hypothetical protein [Chloroflexota bacterium]
MTRTKSRRDQPKRSAERQPSWLIAEYQPTALFSLKPAWATSSGGKSLLVPTPYAIKMALLDAACRTVGVAVAKEVWPQLRDLTIALQPPKRVVVTNLFARILKPRRNPAKPGTPHSGPLGKTIAFREYVHFDGSLGIALGGALGDRSCMEDWLLQINYLGKRGGFVQLLTLPVLAEKLPPGFVVIDGDPARPFHADGIIQQLDDCDATLTFEKADIYSGKRIRLGKERILHHVVLPYRLVSSSKSFSYYERID